MLWLNLVYFTAACIVLAVSSTILVKRLEKIAIFLRITEFAAAFIIMAIATSLPELFVGITSAISKNSGLSFGNVIGANILDMTLIIGIIALTARGIKVKKENIKDSLFMSLIVLLPLVLFLIGNTLSRIDGGILLIVSLIYSLRILKRRRKFTKKLEGKTNRWDLVITIFVFIMCLITLVVSSKFVVEYAINISQELELPQIMIGLFLISIGTTLPELTFGVRAAQMAHGEMALGDQIGTVIYNSTFVLGIVALISPITATFTPFIISAAFMLLVAFLFMTFVGSGKKLDTKEGVSLILLYVFFVMVEFYTKAMA